MLNGVTDDQSLEARSRGAADRAMDDTIDDQSVEAPEQRSLLSSCVAAAEQQHGGCYQSSVEESSGIAGSLLRSRSAAGGAAAPLELASWRQLAQAQQSLQCSVASNATTQSWHCDVGGSGVGATLWTAYRDRAP